MRMLVEVVTQNLCPFLENETEKTVSFLFIIHVCLFEKEKMNIHVCLFLFVCVSYSNGGIVKRSTFGFKSFNKETQSTGVICVFVFSIFYVCFLFIHILFYSMFVCFYFVPVAGSIFATVSRAVIDKITGG